MPPSRSPLLLDPRTDGDLTDPSPHPRRRSPGRGSDYASLSRTIRDAGLLQRRHRDYAVRLAGVLCLFAGAGVALVLVGDSWWQLLSAVGLAVAFTQAAFLGHDGGHQQVFAGRRANDLFGRLIGNLLVGLSYGWWVSKHNRHHANPNKEDHDPDIGDGVLAFTVTQAERRSGRVGRAVLRHQAWLFFPLLTFEGLNLRIAGVVSLARRDGQARRPQRLVEIILILVHLSCYLAVPLLVMSPLKALAFVAVNQAAFGFYMGCSFAPNHKGMRTFGPDEDVDYLRRQVLTSRNVRGGRFVDWLLGGLNYQIEHHLFPNMPRSALPRARPVVREYCAQQRIPYTETSLFGSYRAALRYLHGLGAPLRAER